MASPSSDDREARLAAALKANLARRKALARGLASGADGKGQAMLRDRPVKPPAD